MCRLNFFWSKNLFIERAKLHQIADTVTQLLASSNFVCLDAEWDAHTRTLRVFIDHPEGVDIDQCAKVSGLLVESTELDAILNFDFNLEVSSPGIERPLRTLADFECARSDSFAIEVKLTEKYKNRRKGVGRVTNISADHMISMTTAEGPWIFPWSMVLKATKVVDWSTLQG
jgi:ribosome maturation factor RimP